SLNSGMSDTQSLRTNVRVTSRGYCTSRRRVPYPERKHGSSAYTKRLYVHQFRISDTGQLDEQGSTRERPIGQIAETISAARRSSCAAPSCSGVNKINSAPASMTSRTPSMHVLGLPKTATAVKSVGMCA